MHRQSSRIPASCAREETPESRGMPCLFLNTERGFGGKSLKKSGFRRHLAGSKMPKEGSIMPKEGSKMPKEGSKMPKETFFHGDLPLESGLVARARCLGFLAGVAAASRPRSSATATEFDTAFGRVKAILPNYAGEA